MNCNCQHVGSSCASIAGMSIECCGSKLANSRSLLLGKYNPLCTSCKQSNRHCMVCGCARVSVAGQEKGYSSVAESEYTLCMQNVPHSPLGIFMTKDYGWEGPFPECMDCCWWLMLTSVALYSIFQYKISNAAAVLSLGRQHYTPPSSSYVIFCALKAASCYLFMGILQKIRLQPFVQVGGRKYR